MTGPDPNSRLLEVRGLSVHFPVYSGVLQRATGHVKAVDGVSFEVAKARPWAWSVSPAVARPPSGGPSSV